MILPLICCPFYHLASTVITQHYPSLMWARWQKRQTKTTQPSRPHLALPCLMLCLQLWMNLGWKLCTLVLGANSSTTKQPNSHPTAQRCIRRPSGKGSCASEFVFSRCPPALAEPESKQIRPQRGAIPFGPEVTVRASGQVPGKQKTKKNYHMCLKPGSTSFVPPGRIHSIWGSG